MAVVHDLNAKLRGLRDRLARETQQARSQARAPEELIRRLQAALDCAHGVCALSSVMRGVAGESPVVVVARSNALIQAHLALHDWECWSAVEPPEVRAPAAVPVNRRHHVRFETQMAVRLGTLARSARDVSAGGLFVKVPSGELPRLAARSVVQVTVELGRGREVAVAAEVLRREASGLGLRWIDDSQRAHRDIAALVDCVARAAKP
jgi:hypothetical protein